MQLNSSRPLEVEQQIELRAPVIVVGDSNRIHGGIRAGKNLAIFASTGDVSRRGNRIFLLDGVGIVGSNAVTSSGNVADFLSQKIPNGSLESMAQAWSSSIKNPCAAFVLDIETEEALCLPDPLGGALAFNFRFGSTSIISTDMVSLVNTARALQLPINKSAEYQLERLLIGNGGLNASSYEGVERLSPFQYWHASRYTTENRSYPKPDVDVSYSESIQAIRKDLIESVLAISKLPSERRTAHITGGFDSRLVLAATIDAGCSDSFFYFCSGPSGSTDRQIADGLSNTFHLKRSTGGGLVAAPLQHVHERLLAPLYHSGGITSSGPNGGESRTNSIVVGGGYGEILRSFYSARFQHLTQDEISPSSLIHSLVPASSDMRQIYSDDIFSSLGNKLYEEWNCFREYGYDPDFMGDALYLGVRNRYHIGQNSMLWSRVGQRFDPLYSVHAVTAASNLPLYSRNANILGFDIMSSFRSRLERYRFDRNRFSPEYHTLRRVQSQLTLEESELVRFDDTHKLSFDAKVAMPQGLEELAVESPVLSGEERKSVIAKANKIGLNFWHIATLEPAQKSLRAGLNMFGLTAANGLIDEKYAWHLAKSKLTKRSEIRDVYAMYGLVSWLGVE